MNFLPAVQAGTWNKEPVNSKGPDKMFVSEELIS